jgi:hypothetical protein
MNETIKFTNGNEITSMPSVEVTRGKGVFPLYIIPDEMPKFKDRFSLDNLTARSKYIEEGMFAFVSWKWVNPLAEWIGERKCLEVMAGRGILSFALRQKGIDIIVTDDFSWANTLEHCKSWINTVTDVENMDAIKAVEQYGSEINVLIMSWAYMDDTAYRVIKRLYEVNPFAQVIYIGEGRGGCTADDSFFEHFEIIEDEKFVDVEDNFERWFGLHDRPILGRYTDKF